jgi:hypothetical protein
MCVDRLFIDFEKGHGVMKKAQGVMKRALGIT